MRPGESQVRVEIQVYESPSLRTADYYFIGVVLELRFLAIVCISDLNHFYDFANNPPQNLGI